MGHQETKPPLGGRPSLALLTPAQAAEALGWPASWQQLMVGAMAAFGVQGHDHLAAEVLAYGQLQAQPQAPGPAICARSRDLLHTLGGIWPRDAVAEVAERAARFEAGGWMPEQALDLATAITGNWRVRPMASLGTIATAVAAAKPKAEHAPVEN